MHLEDTPVHRLFVFFSVPAVSGMLISALYVIIDGIFIGRGVGGDGLAAVNVAYPAITLCLAMALMFGIGAATIVAISHAENKPIEANQAVGNMIWLNFVGWLTVGITVILFREPLLKLICSSARLRPLAEDYLIPALIFNIFYMLSIGLNALVRNDKAPGFAMWGVAIGAVTNIVLDWIFIFEFKWGMAGAAYATGIAQLASTAFLCLHFFRKKCTLRPRFDGPQLQIVKRVVVNGFPSFILEFAVAVITLMFNVTLLKMIGEIGVAAFSAIAYIFYIFRMIFSGLAQGIQPIVSYNYGVGRWDRVRATLILGHRISLLSATILFIAVYLAGHKLVEFFNADVELIKLATRGLILYCSAMIFLGANFINISYLQSMELAKPANWLSVGRSFVFILIAVFTLPLIMGIDGVWLALPAADFMTFLITAWWMRRNKKKLDKRDDVLAV